MTTEVGKFLHPGEVQHILENEKERRQKTRLNQVRHLSRKNSLRIISAVKLERCRQIHNLRGKLEKDWCEGRIKELEELGVQYSEYLSHVGDGHMGAQNEVSANHTRKTSAENWARAKARGQEALVKLSLERASLHEGLLRKRNVQKSVCEAENERAKCVASLLPTRVFGTETETGRGALDSLSISEQNIRSHPSAACEAIDAQAAAEMEEAIVKDERDKRQAAKTEMSIQENKRFIEACTLVEQQKEYNRMMGELEELVDLDKSVGENFGSIVNKKQLVAEQEAIIEELFRRLSIPLHCDELFPDSVEVLHTTVDISESTQDTPVHHILVSHSSDSKAVDSIQHPSTLALSYGSSESGPTNLQNGHSVASKYVTTSSSSKTLPSVRDACFASISFIPTEETILASHLNDRVSSIMFDFSLPNTEDSSTKFPLSTSWSALGVTSYDSKEQQNGASLSDSVTPGGDLKYADGKCAEDIHGTVREAAMETSEFSKLQHLLSDGGASDPEHVPIFRNLAVHRQNVGPGAHHLVVAGSAQHVTAKPSNIDKSSSSSLLSHLLLLAVKRRTSNIPTDNASQKIPLEQHRPGASASSLKAASARSPIRMSDLKASFLLESHKNLQAGLEERSVKREDAFGSSDVDDGRRGSAKLPPSVGDVVGARWARKEPQPVLATVQKLSTIQEFDVPDSPQHKMPPEHAAYGIDDDRFFSETETSAVLQDRGITDEPDLTLVGTDSSLDSFSENANCSSSCYNSGGDYWTAGPDDCCSKRPTVTCPFILISKTRSRDLATEAQQSVLNRSSEPTAMSSDMTFSARTPTISGTSAGSWNNCFLGKSCQIQLNPSLSTSSLQMSGSVEEGGNKQPSSITSAWTRRSTPISELFGVFDSTSTPNQVSVGSSCPKSQRDLNALPSMDRSLAAFSDQVICRSDNAEEDICDRTRSSHFLPDNNNFSSVIFNQSDSSSLLSFLKHEISASSNSSGTHTASGIETSMF